MPSHITEPPCLPLVANSSLSRLVREYIQFYHIWPFGVRASRVLAMIIFCLVFDYFSFSTTILFFLAGIVQLIFWSGTLVQFFIQFFIVFQDLSCYVCLFPGL